MATHSSVLAWRIPGTRGVWWAAIYGVALSRTGLMRLSSSSSSSIHIIKKIDHKNIEQCLPPNNALFFQEFGTLSPTFHKLGHREYVQYVGSVRPISGNKTNHIFSKQIMNAI